MSTTGEMQKERLTADIVIIGGGGSGLPAAATAVEAGVKNIIVLEKRNILGGDANMAGGMFAVESVAQKRIGETYTRDEAFREKMDISNWTIDPRVVRAFVNTTAEVVDWLENKGLRFDWVGELGVRGETPRVFHKPVEDGEPVKVGPAVIKLLTEQCRDVGVRFMLNTTATRIMLDDGGNVAGVWATNKESEIEISTKAVVIAAGDFAGNKEMIDKYFKPHGYLHPQCLPLTGDGIKMAEELGAFTDDVYAMNCMGPHHFPYATGQRPLQILIHRPEIIFVNKHGERFCDESLNLGKHHQVANSLSRQPDEVCYALIDAGIIETMIQEQRPYRGHALHQGFEWMEQLVEQFVIDDEKGVAKVSDSLDEIADYIGAKPEVLKETIDQYNDACEKGYDADFLKDKSFLYPFRKPPYYALLGRQGFYSTFGGIKVNRNMEVYNREFNTIGGLYATGNNVGSCISTVYVDRHAGTSIGFAICSGYIAGQSAARYVMTGR